MNPDTGEMKEMSDKLMSEMLEQKNNKFVELPKIAEVLEIRGCKFAVKSYDTGKREMILIGLSDVEAKEILMGSNLERIIENRKDRE